MLSIISSKRNPSVRTVILLASTIAFAEGESGCEWETIEETETYLQEKCGDGMARIRSKPIDSTIVYVKTEDAVERILNGENEIVLTPQDQWIRRLQHELAGRYNLKSKSFGREPDRKVQLSND